MKKTYNSTNRLAIVKNSLAANSLLVVNKETTNSLVPLAKANARSTVNRLVVVKHYSSGKNLAPVPANNTPNMLIKGSYKTGTYIWPADSFDWPGQKLIVQPYGKNRKKGVWTLTEREMDLFHQVSGLHQSPTGEYRIHYYAGLIRREGCFQLHRSRTKYGGFKFTFIISINGNWNNCHILFGLYKLFGKVGSVQVGSPKTEGSGLNWGLRNVWLMERNVFPIMDKMQFHGLKALQYEAFKERRMYYRQRQREKPRTGIIERPLPIDVQNKMLVMIDRFKEIDFYFNNDYYRSGSNPESLPVMHPRFISGFGHGDFSNYKKTVDNRIYLTVKFTQVPYNAFILYHLHLFCWLCQQNSASHFVRRHLSFTKLYKLQFDSGYFMPSGFFNNPDRMVIREELEQTKAHEIGLAYSSYETGLVWLEHLKKYPSYRACEAEQLRLVEALYKIRRFANRHNCHWPRRHMVSWFADLLRRHERPISRAVALLVIRKHLGLALPRDLRAILPTMERIAPKRPIPTMDVLQSMFIEWKDRIRREWASLYKLGKFSASTNARFLDFLDHFSLSFLYFILLNYIFFLYLLKYLYFLINIMQSSQLMALGWKRLLPLRLAGFVRNAVFVFVAQII